MISGPKSHIEPDFDLQYPTSNRIFTPDNNKVIGALSLTFVDDFEGITSIDYGFRGKGVTRYDKLELSTVQHEGLPRNLDRHQFEDEFLLFDEVGNVFNSQMHNGQVSSVIHNGIRFSLPFNFQFPRATSLPSSCKNFGDVGDNQGSITINYQLYAKISYISLFYPHGTSIEYTCDLPFQGGSNIQSFSRPITLSGLNTFRKKGRFSPTGSRSMSRSGSSSSSTVNKNKKSSSHSHSHSSSTTATTSIKDIQLGIFAQFPESLNVALPLTSIPITIKFPQISNLEPDFVHNGKSTKLGLFEVKIVIIRLTQNVYIRCKGHSYKCTKDSNLVYHQRHSSNKRFQFDIKDFIYSEAENCYLMNVTLADLIKNNNPLVEILKKPFTTIWL
ncbi:unnamed protein product [Ambrosiozyma monospora]|uniref:Unnamed protein product n=1 Tax=Ambrosiozyma monospora TaxID=43982 RepID=A0A9W6Z3L4_AMBMO|nr:unnamed protein product [Ambrosiozyma monospora]